jgi:hypothetical protein
MYISEDSLPYTPLQTASNYRTWFYFNVTGVPRGETLTFSMRNMNNQGRLCKLGLRPAYKVLPNTQKEWKRLPHDIAYDYMDEGPFFITFTYTFNHDESEVAYFAFTYPFSFAEILK